MLLDSIRTSESIAEEYMILEKEHEHSLLYQLLEFLSHLDSAITD